MHWRQTSRSSFYDKPCHEFSIFFFFQQGWKFLEGIQQRETRKAQGLTSRDCIFSPDNRSASVLQDMRIFIQSCWPVDSSVQPVVEGETSCAAAYRCPPHVYSVRLHIHTEPDEFPCHGDLFPVCFPHLPAVVKLLTVALSTVFLPNRRLICSGWLMSRAGYLLLHKCFCSYRQAAAGCVSAKCGLTSCGWATGIKPLSPDILEASFSYGSLSSLPTGTENVTCLLAAVPMAPQAWNPRSRMSETETARCWALVLLTVELTLTWEKWTTV